MINFIKLRRQIINLTTKVAEGTDTLLGITSKGVPVRLAVSDFNPFHAHVSFDSSPAGDFDGSLISSHNIKRVTRSEKGVYVIEFNSSHATGNYTVIGTSGSGNHTSSARAVSIDARSTTSVTVRVERTDTGAQMDSGYVAVMVLS